MYVSVYILYTRVIKGLGTLLECAIWTGIIVYKSYLKNSCGGRGECGMDIRLL